MKPKESQTPRCEAAQVWARVVDQTDHGPPHELMVYAEDYQKLELENAALRKALGLYHETFNDTRNHIELEHQMPFRAAWEAARAALGEGVTALDSPADT